MNETKHWTIHAEFVILLVTLLGGFYLLDGKIERTTDAQSSRIAAQAARTDRLYEMFIDLVKERGNHENYHHERTTRGKIWKFNVLNVIKIMSNKMYCKFYIFKMVVK